MRERPVNMPWPYLNPNNPLFRGLVFAGLGAHPGNFGYHDCSPYKNHGTLTGYTGAGNTPVNRWGRAIGRANLSFDGTADYVALPGGAVITDPPMTLCGWFRANNDTIRFVIAGMANAAASYFTLEVDGSAEGNPVSATSREAGAPLPQTSSTGPFTADVWQHAAGVFRSSTSRIAYLNGIPGAENTISSSPTAITAAGVGSLVRSTPLLYFAGRLADVLIWSRVLSPAEICSLADPSNVMLGGLIRDPRPNRAFIGQVGAAGNRRRRLLICGAA